MGPQPPDEGGTEGSWGVERPSMFRMDQGLQGLWFKTRAVFGWAAAQRGLLAI